MSRDIGLDDLSIEDVKYLQDRGELPPGEREVVVNSDGSLSYAGEDTETFDEIDEGEDGLEKLSPAKLRQRLEDMQLSTDGEKRELIQRIRENS